MEFSGLMGRRHGVNRPSDMSDHGEEIWIYMSVARGQEYFFFSIFVGRKPLEVVFVTQFFIYL